MTVDELNVIITAQSREFDRVIDQVVNRLDDMEDHASRSVSGITNIFSNLGRKVAALGLGKMITDSIKISMDAVESESLFQTSLGGYADSAREWSENLAENLGLNAYELRKNVGVLYTMTSAMGIAKDQALSMSERFTALAEDMASFYNLSSAEAFQKLRAGLTGESEPLKALGILIDENTVKNYALQEGIIKQGETMTEQQKVMARYAAILGQTKVAQNDLARTMDSPSNKLRRLQNQMTQLQTQIGNQLMPVAVDLLTIASNVLTAAAPYIDKIAAGTASVTDALLNMSTPAKNALAIAVAAGMVIPAVTAAQNLYTQAGNAWSAALGVLIPKQLTWTSALKATAGWLMIGAMLIAGLAEIGSTAEKMKSTNDAITDSGDSAAEASQDVDGLAASLEGVGEAAKASLADVDKLNIATSSKKSGTIGGMDFGAFAESAAESTDSVKDMLKDLQDSANGMDFSSMGMNLGETFAKAKKGIDVIRDAFDFDSDNQIESLRILNSEIEKIFGTEWTDKWIKIGSDIYTSLNGTPEERDNVLKNWQDLLEDMENEVPTFTDFLEFSIKTNLETISELFGINTKKWQDAATGALDNVEQYFNDKLKEFGQWLERNNVMAATPAETLVNMIKALVDDGGSQGKYGTSSRITPRSDGGTSGHFGSVSQPDYTSYSGYTVSGNGARSTGVSAETYGPQMPTMNIPPINIYLDGQDVSGTVNAVAETNSWRSNG